jgi:hypothetical protein
LLGREDQRFIFIFFSGGASFAATTLEQQQVMMMMSGTYYHTRKSIRRLFKFDPASEHCDFAKSAHCPD